MYENDEVVEDLDLDIKTKEELVEEAKKLQESGSSNAIKEAGKLRKKWRKLANWESLEEENLRDQFEKALDGVYAKQKEINAKNKELKEELIKKAEGLSASEEWNKATKELGNLMGEWKKLGSAGKDIDDELWEKFNGARQTFYDRKHQHWEELNAKFESAKKVKEELIEKAKELQDSEEFQKTANKYNELMAKWKEAGSAGKEYEQKLWEEFNGARQKFYDRLNVYYDKLHKEQKENYDAKNSLVGEAQEILDAEDYSRENTNAMKELGKKWKEIGFSGKDKEDKIWNSFRGVMDQYFDGLKQFNEEKHENWVNRMNDVKQNKQDLVNNLTKKIQRLENDAKAALGQHEEDAIKEQIEDIKTRIGEVQKEIEDIVSKLEK